MNIVRGNFLRGLSDPVGVVVAPTNGVITHAGLVMGAGAALALARHQPQLRQALARRIERDGVREGRFWRYGFVAVRLEDRLYGAFQSKLDFRRGSDLELVRFSAGRLRLWLVEHPGVVVHLAFPGIGLGGLSPEAVWGVLEATLAEVSGAVRLYRKGARKSQNRPEGTRLQRPRAGGLRELCPQRPPEPQEGIGWSRPSGYRGSALER